MRWFFYYLTVPVPVGGLKHIRLMASLLRELGVETYLLRDGPVPVASDLDDTHLYDIPVAEAPFASADAGAQLRPEEVLVLPEVAPATLHESCRSWKCRLALYNQNGFYALRKTPFPRQMGRRFDFALANAPYVAGICKTFLGIPRDRIFLVPYWVLRDPFRASETGRRLAVCYMPRKLSEQVQVVRELVQRAEPDVPWVEIDGIPSDEVALRFRENAVFFSTQHLEGFGLPAAGSDDLWRAGCGVSGHGGIPPPLCHAGKWPMGA